MEDFSDKVCLSSCFTGQMESQSTCYNKTSVTVNFIQKSWCSISLPTEADIEQRFM